MAKPVIHARSSAKRFGGRPEDYLEIHDFLDSSKAVFPDNRHRALTHNSWFIFVCEKVFGHEIEVSCDKCDGSGIIPDPDRGSGWGPYWDSECDCSSGKLARKVSVRDVCEQHILEDFGNKFIPTPGDYLEHMEFQPWMNNAIEGSPTSHRKINKNVKKRTMLLD